MGFSKEYFRKKRKESYEADKKLSELYRSLDAEPGETFSAYRRRKKFSL